MLQLLLRRHVRGRPTTAAAPHVVSVWPLSLPSPPHLLACRTKNHREKRVLYVVSLLVPAGLAYVLCVSE